MENLIREISEEAYQRDMTPQSLLRRSISASWGTWDEWKSGQSTPTMATVDKIRDWLTCNPIRSEVV